MFGFKCHSTLICIQIEAQFLPVPPCNVFVTPRVPARPFSDAHVSLKSFGGTTSALFGVWIKVKVASLQIISLFFPFFPLRSHLPSSRLPTWGWNRRGPGLEPLTEGRVGDGKQMRAFIAPGNHINMGRPRGPRSELLIRLWWGRRGMDLERGGACVSQVYPGFHLQSHQFSVFFYPPHCFQTEWTGFLCFQQHWSASVLGGAGTRDIRGKNDQLGLEKRLWLTFLGGGKGGGGGVAGVCVCNVEEQSNKRPKQEKVGCLAHSVWVLNYSFVFLFWVKCCFVFHIAGRSSKKG